MRERILGAAISAFFALLVASLAYTQIVRYNYYSRLSKNNAIRIVPIDAPRGVIFDRNGVPLVTSRLSFDVAVVYQELRERERLIRLLTDTLGLSRERVVRSLSKARIKPYTPVTNFEDINIDKAFSLEEASFDVDGLVIETSDRRHYRFNETASQIFGYFDELSTERFEHS